MRSKTSFSEYFNPTLFRRNLTRFWPLWGMATFAACLAPLAVLTNILWMNVETVEAVEVTLSYYSAVCYAVPVISLLYAVLCAMAVWSYLYNARSVGMTHTLPIRREGLLVTNFLSGMAMLLIPYAVAGTMFVAIAAALGAFDPTGTLVTILCVLGLNFFYFCTATFAALITGNIFALPALYFLLHFLAVIADFLVCILARNFLLGFNTDYSGTVEFLCPTVYLVRNLRFVQETRREMVPLSGGGSYERIVTTAVHPGNLWTIAIWALVGLGLLALAWLLYRRRSSERAGEVAGAKWMQPVFRAVAAALCAVTGGQLLYALFWSGIQRGNYYDAVPLAIFMAIAGIIGYFATSMLLAKSLKVFYKKRLLGAAGVAAFAFLLCLGLNADLLGVERRVPAVSEIESLRLDVANNSYTLYAGEDDGLIEQVRALHQTIVADKAYVSQEEFYNSYTETGEVIRVWESVRLDYRMRDGSTVRRYYNLILAKERMAQPGTYDYLLDQLVNSEVMKLRRLHAGDERLSVSGGYLYNEVTGYDVDLGTREAQALLAAVEKDAEAGTWGSYNWFDRDDADAYALRFHLEFQDAEGYHDSISITAREDMDNTVRCLKELDLVTDYTLLTNRQLYPEQYRDDAPDEKNEAAAGYEDAVEYPDSIVYPEDAYVSANPSIGIIGGADGPTAVFVTGG